MGPAIMNLVRWQRSNHGAPAAAAGASLCGRNGRKPRSRRDALAPEAKRLCQEKIAHAGVPQAWMLHDAIDSIISRIEIVGPSPGEASTRVVPRAPDLEIISVAVKPTGTRSVGCSLASLLIPPAEVQPKSL